MNKETKPDAPELPPLPEPLRRIVEAWNNLDPEHLLAIEYSALGDAIQDAATRQPELVAEVFDTFGNSQDAAKCIGHVWLAPNYFPPKGTKLYAQPPADLKDAQRYRWLTDGDGRMEFGIQPGDHDKPPRSKWRWIIDYTKAEADAFIDAAMLSSVPTGEKP